MASVKFTADRRERFLTLLERGDSLEAACADVGVSRTTVAKWAARGRAGVQDDGSPEFAFRLDEIREGKGEAHLSREDLIRLLEKQARKGSVRAAALLLDRPWERKSDAAETATESEQQDPFAALEGDELAPRRAARGGSST